ncbi:PilZ domain-containing protein [Thermodesulfatator atlanticus]|uniref:PilZ domain-containing protein n=1 Tax=Thermodesulfatator atlanticus TaxID=501497 RepID=UPI0003B7420D|nr:PilZ domain-containing protein [Thermodesulfatator atlanticus]
MEQERRRHIRVKLKGSKVFLPDGQEGELANASISGIAFWQPNGASLKPGDTLSIVLTYQGEEINGEARVVHLNGRLVGCEWIDFANEKQRMAYYSWLLEPEFE